MLPRTIKVSQLYGFVEKYMRESNRTRNMNMIVKNLLKADQLQVWVIEFRLLMFFQAIPISAFCRLKNNLCFIGREE